MNRNSKIYIAGHRGLVGSAIVKNLAIQNNVIHNAYKYGVTKLLFLGST